MKEKSVSLCWHTSKFSPKCEWLKKKQDTCCSMFLFSSCKTKKIKNVSYHTFPTSFRSWHETQGFTVNLSMINGEK